MSRNQTIESPQFERIGKEAGQFTVDGFNLLWSALNDTRATERRDFTRAKESLEPKLKQIAPSASQNNIDTEGASVVEFVGGSAQNLTGFRAPETNKTRLLFLYVSQAGTITVKNDATSETANRIITNTGADVSLTTGKGMLLIYLSSKWRQVL